MVAVTPDPAEIPKRMEAEGASSKPPLNNRPRFRAGQQAITGASAGAVFVRRGRYGAAVGLQTILNLIARTTIVPRFRAPLQYLGAFQLPDEPSVESWRRASSTRSASITGRSTSPALREHASPSGRDWWISRKKLLWNS